VARRRRRVEIEIAGDAGGAERAFRDTSRASDRAADDITDAGRRGARGFERETSGLGGKLADVMRSVGPALAAAAAAVGVAAGAALAAGVLDQVGQKLEAGATGDLIATRLGMDESSQAQLGKDAGAAFLAGYGDSIAANIEVGGRIAQLTGLSTDEITDRDIGLTYTIAELLGVDPDELLQAGRVAEGAGTPLREFYDILAAGVPRGFNIPGDSLEAFTEFASKLGDFDVDVEDLVVLDSVFSRAGVRDAGRTFDVLTEFFNFTSAGSEATQDAFGALGLSWRDAMRRIDQGDAVGVLDDIFDRIDQVDPSKTPDILANIFGGPGEDVGLGVLARVGDALDGTTDSLGDYNGEAERVDERMWDNLATRMEVLKRRFLALLSPMADGVLPVLEDLVGFAERLMAAWGEDGLAGVIDELGDKLDDLRGWFNDLSPAMQGVVAGLAALVGLLVVAGVIAAIGAALALILNPVTLVAAAIAGLVGAFVWAYGEFPAFRGVVDGVVSWFTGTAVPNVVGAFEWMAERAPAALVVLADAWSATWRWMDETLGRYRGSILGLFEGLLEIITGLFDTFAGIFTGDWDRFWLGLWSTVNGVWGLILSTVNLAWSTIWTVLLNGMRLLRALFTWDWLWRSLWSTWSTIAVFLASIPTRILEGLGSLGSLLWNAGWDVISGLGRGMRDAWGGVSNWLGGLGGAIVGLKGPPEHDAVLLEHSGELIMSGLWSGMSEVWDDTIAPGLGGITGTMGGAPMGGTPAAPGPAPVEVRLVIDSGNDPMDQVLVQVLQRAIATTAGGDVQLALGYSR
jgi:phage-related minor tail protein